MGHLNLSNVTKSFGPVDVIKGVDLDVKDGEFCVFVGPSGCGKSTLLRIIAGLEDATSGDILIDGKRVNPTPPSDREIAMVFQSYALYPHLTVRDNMALGLKQAGTPKATIEERVASASKMLSLEPLLARRPSELSGGQRQRVAIGRAIVRTPKLFLFDEPLSNLDAALRVNTRIEIARLHRELAATMIYVTHDQVEAMTLADKIFVLQGGIVRQAGRPLDLYDDPDNRFVAGFIGSPSMNFVSGRLAAREDGVAVIEPEGGQGGVIRARLRSEGVAPGTQVMVGMRPEHVALSESAGEGLPVKVEMEEDLGGVSYLHARSPAGTGFVLERRGDRVNYEGREIRVTVPPAKALVFDASGERLR
jgi:lactose/L-arabinose transport system ATP-binding protein